MAEDLLHLVPDGLVVTKQHWPVRSSRWDDRSDTSIMEELLDSLSTAIATVSSLGHLSKETTKHAFHWRYRRPDNASERLQG